MSMSPLLLDVLARRMREDLLEEVRHGHLAERAGRLREHRAIALRSALRWLLAVGGSRLPEANSVPTMR